MRLLKKKTAPEKKQKPVLVSSGGRPLLVYFLPTLVVATLLMLLIAVMAQQSIGKAAWSSARGAATTAAESIALRLEGEILARRDLVALALADGAVASALQRHDDQALQRLQLMMQQRIPGLLHIRLLPPDVSQPDPSGPAPLGYAGLDMLRQTFETGRPSPAEIHQIKSGAPYLALALPVSLADGSRAGVVFAAWDMRPIVQVVTNSPRFSGQLQLLQGGSGGYVVADGPGQGQITDSGGDGVVDVPNSIWQLGYAVNAKTGGLADLTTTLGIAGGAALALLLMTLLQLRILGRDLRLDMGTLVNLGEAIMRRDATGSATASVASCGDAVALLVQYARDARNLGANLPSNGAMPALQSRVPVANRAPGVEVEELQESAADLLTGSEKSAAAADVPETLFRAYDIRGVIGESLTSEIARLVGLALGSLVQEQGGHRVAVAFDARQSSPELASALINGICGTGCDVLEVGQAATPLLYFAMQNQPVQAGIIVTGSHNPPEYNGFKIVLGDRVLDGDELLALRQRMLEGAFKVGQGQVERIDLIDEYVEAVVGEVQLARPLKLVVDAGNGVAGELALAVFEALGCEVVPLFCEPDGNFPNHHPDPSQPDNLTALMIEVQAQEADIGFAFDGDGDRLGVVDNAGENIWPDRVLMMLAADVLGRHPGVDILYDVKSSRHLASFILSHGGRPIMWKSGHSRMRAKMLETGALLGGEFSGHLFIKERWFGFDDAVYAATRVLELLAFESRSASEIFAELPMSPSTPEYKLMLEEGQSAELMRALDAHKVFDDARLVELDGLRVEFANGWGLIRPSNTSPALTFRFEADDESAQEQIKARFRDLLRRVAPDLQAPF